MVHLCNYSVDACYGRKELDLLLQLSDMLGENDLNLDFALEILSKHLNSNRLILTVQNRNTGLITIAASFGISDVKGNSTRICIIVSMFFLSLHRHFVRESMMYLYSQTSLLKNIVRSCIKRSKELRQQRSAC